MLIYLCPKCNNRLILNFHINDEIYFYSFSCIFCDFHITEKVDNIEYFWYDYISQKFNIKIKKIFPEYLNIEHGDYLYCSNCGCLGKLDLLDGKTFDDSIYWDKEKSRWACYNCKRL